MTGDARRAWVIAGGGFLAAVAIAVGLVAVSSWLVDSADREEAPPGNARRA
ncbi:hypothetical protein [Microbacterium sp. BK668]|uniref:hypothetical protein n=1 Tax=Microbacterium sp. BK668 TaxID=2512118 RepID=UPI0010DB71C5|nr:hypothetical protein [Microbacterium sp. BK668]TDN91497.1 hypothetical protein EV279_0997 [Microbacterium sp. BK668]